ncbi:MAG: hypothetical protein ACYTDT_07820 [Planctomycetota bacterium]
MYWTAIELQGITQRGGSDEEAEAVIEKANERDLEVERSRGGGVEIRVEDGHKLNEHFECHHYDDPVRKMSEPKPKEPRTEKSERGIH